MVGFSEPSTISTAVALFPFRIRLEIKGDTKYKLVAICFLYGIICEQIFHLSYVRKESTERGVSVGDRL